MEKFLLDMHMHTKETSSCGEVPAAEGVRLYKEAGYQGIMITDHYHKQYFDSLGDIGMPGGRRRPRETKSALRCFSASSFGMWSRKMIFSLWE